MSDRQAVPELEQKCPYCGRSNSAQAIHCFECGTELPPSVADQATSRPLVQPVKTVIMEGKPKSEQKCSYCGRSNAVEATYCLECGTKLDGPLIDETISAAPVQPVTSATAEADTNWKAPDAWKFLGMLIVFELVAAISLGAIGNLYPSFRHWSHTGAGHLFSFIVYGTIDILTMLYFARVESLNTFLRAFGLERSPSSAIWFGIVVTLTLRATGHILIAKGWSKGATTTSLWGFHHTVGLERYLYLTPALLAPFYEELFIRGFLYKALRGSYSVPVSTFIILAFTSLTHFTQFSPSWAAAVTLSLLTVLVCTLRERTGNLWDCIISHLVFNVTGAFRLFVFN